MFKCFDIITDCQLQIKFLQKFFTFEKSNNDFSMIF